MAAEIQKHLKYTKDLAVTFFELCQQGLTLTQTAEKLGVDKQRLIKWSKDPTKYEWQNAWVRGRQACQAYHEVLLDEMIRNGKNYDAASKQLQKMRMERMFDDWKERPTEAKIEHTHNQQTPEQMKEEITRLLSKANIRNEFGITVPTPNGKTEETSQEQDSGSNEASTRTTKEGSSTD